MQYEDFARLINTPAPAVAPRRYQKNGRLIGPGNGVSDSIPAAIHAEDGSVSPAMLSEGEYVIRADAVSMLGGGSTDAGARFLDAFVEELLKLDREQAAFLTEVITSVMSTVKDAKLS